MKNSPEYQTNKSIGFVAKMVSIGCGTMLGIAICALATFFALTLLPLVIRDTFTLEDLPVNLTTIILLIAIVGTILGGIGGYFLFFRLAYKDVEARGIAQLQAQQAFDEAVENAVEEALNMRNIV